MRCGASDEKRDAATGQKNPAFRQWGWWATAAHRLRCGACPMSHIELRTAPARPIARMSRSGPSNDRVWSEDTLVLGCVYQGSVIKTRLL